MSYWEFRKPEVLKVQPRELLPSGEEGDEVTGFCAPYWIYKFEVRRTVTILERTLWRGKWQAMRRATS